MLGAAYNWAHGTHSVILCLHIFNTEKWAWLQIGSEGLYLCHHLNLLFCFSHTPHCAWAGPKTWEHYCILVRNRPDLLLLLLQMLFCMCNCEYTSASKRWLLFYSACSWGKLTSSDLVPAWHKLHCKHFMALLLNEKLVKKKKKMMALDLLLFSMDTQHNLLRLNMAMQASKAGCICVDYP